MLGIQLTKAATQKLNHLTVQTFVVVVDVAFEVNNRTVRTIKEIHAEHKGSILGRHTRSTRIMSYHFLIQPKKKAHTHPNKLVGYDGRL